MAEKKTQHFVPQMYLAPFLDAEPPCGWSAGRPFEPTVWVAPVSDLNGFRRKAPANILARTRLYNLRSDDPKRPWLEEALGRIESRFGIVRTAIESGRALSIEEYGTLLIFVGALSGRTPRAIDHRQSFVDDLERIHRAVVRGHEEAEKDADRLFADSDEDGKRLLPIWTQAYAEVVARDGFILVNESGMDFITSDQPVCHVFVHIDEYPLVAFPADRRADVEPTVRAHLCFTALTPRHAFVSSPHLRRGEGFYCQTNDTALVFAVNQLTRSLAKDWIISASARPYGDLTNAVMQAEARAGVLPRSGLQVYTEHNRYWLSSTDVSHEPGSHPLVSRITFSTVDTPVLKKLAEDGRIREVTVYEDGHMVSHLKHARLTHVAESKDHRSTIETNLEDLAAG